MSMMKESIVFDNNAGTLDIDDSKTVELKFDGERITLADLKTDDILTVKEAQRIDKSKIFIADISRDVIEGNIQYYDSDEAGSFFEVEGEKHYLSDNYLDFIKNHPNEKLPKSGDYIRAYLGYDSKIAAVKSDKDFSYGYVVSCAYDESDEVVIMKLFTLEGNMKRYYFADRVTVYNDKNLNGIKKEKFDAYKLLGDIKYNTVAYTLNSEGFVTSVAKEIDRTEFVPATIDYPLVLNYNVSDHNGGETWLYRGVLAKKYSIKGSVIVYPGQESMRSDDNAYGVRSAGYWGTEHYFDKDEYMKVYNCDKFYKSGFCTMAGATAVSLDQGTGGLHMFCIESISDTIDEDDMPAKVIKYMENPENFFKKMTYVKNPVSGKEYNNPRMISWRNAQYDENWAVKSGMKWAFADDQAAALVGGATLTFKFTGTTIGLYWGKNNKATGGTYSIDNGAYTGNVSAMFAAVSSEMPMPSIIKNDLPEGEHTITITANSAEDINFKFGYFIVD